MTKSKPKTFEQIMKEYGLKLAARELDRVEATRERLKILCGEEIRPKEDKAK